MVLIGDPAQLSPIICLSKNKEKENDNNQSQFPTVDSLSKTIFHRLQDSFQVRFLDTQYRMHPSICLFPSTMFYEGRLKNGVGINERKPPSFSWPNIECPVCFINVEDSLETRVGTSFSNKGQAIVVQEVVSALIEGGMSPIDIAILQPYAAQNKVIRSLISDPLIDICSIDSFQGKEKEVIIFNTVRASLGNNNSSLGFLDDKYRMNVLLTRARRGLIGIGHSKTLVQGSKLWSEWLNSKESVYQLERKDIKSNSLSNKKSTSSDSIHRRMLLGDGRGHGRLSVIKSKK
jgi:regulator of nonsense transcripts 1